MKILVITKDPDKIQSFKQLLENLRIRTTIIETNNIEKAWLTQYQLIYIHNSIENLEHENLIKKIRNLNWYIPLLTSHPYEQESKNIFLLPKDITEPTLSKVIHNLIKRPHERAFKKLKYKDLILDPHKRIAKRQKKEARLRNKEYDILEIMMRNPGKTITKTELTETLWDRNTTMLSNTLQVHISSLRRKIDKGFTKKLIHTIPCVGYRLGE